MTSKSLKAAGCLAMFSALMSIPAAYLTFRLEGGSGAAAPLIQGYLQVFGTILFVVINRLMKKFLNSRLLFHETDRQIDLMIMANVVAGVLVVSGLLFAQFRDSLGMAAMVIVVLLGIIQIQFGFRLLRLQDNLGGLLKPFCYTNMATGACVASIVFIVAGVVTSAVSDVMLGTIFFAAARQSRESASLQ